MSPLSRDQVQHWIEDTHLHTYVCPDCEGIHLPSWEEKDGVLEARCFVDDVRCSMIMEVGIRSAAVLPLQGAVHFMNFDFGFIKVMLSMTDQDIPRLLLSHAMPVKHITQPQFNEWLSLVLDEMDSVYQQLTEMDVMLVDDPSESISDFDDLLH